MDIRVNKSDLRKVNKMFDKLDALGNKGVDMIIDKNGLLISRDIKLPPIPVDTGNLRNNVVYNAKDKAIESNAPYSGFLEFGTRFQKSQPYFFGKINLGLKRLMLDLNNAIKRSLR
tara:strand:+ start:782 stop:1129 length:348 start_codon:yes stop_codon:yes gene_type:complete